MGCCTCDTTDFSGNSERVDCGTSVCGLDGNTYSCSVNGWTESATGCGATCQCETRDASGNPEIIQCGSTVCGTDNNTWSCSASGWSLSHNGCP
jgi:hypothetical protein